jgi:acyl-CoA reductase-like NAD-dependent aldehyde dehydrogenase
MVPAFIKHTQLLCPGVTHALKLNPSRVAEKASKIRIGDPLDENSQMGPLATRAQLDNIDSTVADAKANGATLVHGGKQPSGI